MPAPGPERIAAVIRRLLRERGAGKSICPSEVARVIAPGDFRRLMPKVRTVAAELMRAKEIVVTQSGHPVDPQSARGPLRFATASIAKTAYVERYRGIDFRKEPDRYRVGRGEEGVLIAEPYKSELLWLWRFRTKAMAETSAAALWRAFVGYRGARDFVGMDMTRKFLQMGFTRARRYANHRSGKKYVASDVGRARTKRQQLPREGDAEKAAAAGAFYAVWQRAERDPAYVAWRLEQKKRR